MRMAPSLGDLGSRMRSKNGNNDTYLESEHCYGGEAHIIPKSIVDKLVRGLAVLLGGV